MKATIIEKTGVIFIINNLLKTFVALPGTIG